LAEVRAELAAGRLRYQAEVQATVDQLVGVSSEGELNAAKTAISEIAQARVEETRRTYLRSNLTLATETFGVTLTPPALAASIASALGLGFFAPAGIATALSLFGAAALLKWGEARASRAENPWSYVLEATQKSRQARLMSRLLPAALSQ
jgi:hypothetical protein